MKHLIKSLSERKRRTFLRYMHGKKKKKSQDDDDEEPTEQEERPRKNRTREELLDKLEKLKVSEKDDFYDDIISTDDEGDVDDGDEWESDDLED